MWYINDILSNPKSNPTSRFILTMWYINYLEVEIPEGKILGFILTMWYINLSVYSCSKELYVKFYINYVVYKSAYLE